ncbi:MAG: class I SAM-dependent methyltransferase [Gemmatimonadales bacterium]
MNPAGTEDEYAAIADLYDHVIPYRDRQDVEFYLEAARSTGGPVLEIGCGTGRILIPTARAGVGIVGLDLSPSMLEQCRTRLLGEPEAVRARARLVRGDMRGFDLGETFALATLPFRPFQHLLTVEDQCSCLAAIRRHLRGGGRLILDLFNPSLSALVQDNLGQALGEEPAFTSPDGRRVVRRHRILARDYASQTTRVELLYDITHPDGREERLVHAFSLRYLFRFEAEHLLVRCGFELEQVYGDYDRSPFGARYPGELILVARRA